MLSKLFIIQSDLSHIRHAFKKIQQKNQMLISLEDASLQKQLISIVKCD